MSHAIRLISERGPGGVRPVDVTEAAAVSSGLFYWYFRDIDDLLQQVVVEGRRAMRRGVADVLEGLSDPLERVYMGSRESVLLAAGSEVMRALAWSDDGSRDSAFAVETERTVAVMIDDALKLMAEGQVEGSIRRDLTPLHLAYCVRGVIHHNVASYYRGTVLGPVEELAEAIAGFVLRAVCTDLDRADEVQSRLGTGPAASVVDAVV